MRCDRIHTHSLPQADLPTHYVNIAADLPEALPPPLHPAFYCSSEITLNVTRGPMADFGYCPSGRLFEAAACGTPILSDTWEGLETFFEPDREILVARNTDEVLAALDRPNDELAAVARAARERTLAEHTADCRAREFEEILETAQYA